jgi:hypothetical protein
MTGLQGRSSVLDRDRAKAQGRRRRLKGIHRSLFCIADRRLLRGNRLGLLPCLQRGSFTFLSLTLGFFTLLAPLEFAIDLIFFPARNFQFIP